MRRSTEHEPGAATDVFMTFSLSGHHRDVLEVVGPKGRERVAEIAAQGHPFLMLAFRPPLTSFVMVGFGLEAIGATADLLSAQLAMRHGPCQAKAVITRRGEVAYLGALNRVEPTDAIRRRTLPG